MRDKWSSLLAEGFEITEEDGHRVALESATVQSVVVLDPRGEVDVYVFPRGRKDHEGWSYTGMVGRASIARILEIALAEMRAEPAILGGDAAFYARLAKENEASAHAWTQYYARRGPRPTNRQLP